jgi:hypothetical protein
VRDLAVGEHAAVEGPHDLVHSDGDAPVPGVGEPPGLDARIDLRDIASATSERG